MSAAETTVLPTPADQFDYAKELLFDALDRHHDPAAIRLIGRLRTELDTHALLVAKRLGDNGQGWAANAAFDKGAETKREANRQQRRVETLRKDARLGERLANGSLKPGHLDAIITASRNAARETTAIPDGVLADVAESSVDQARTRLQRWVIDQTSNDDAEDEYKRQRALRRVARHTNHTLNLPGITIEGDKATIDQIYSRLDAYADDLYRQDGGRDAGAPARTTTQRRFDAVTALLNGTIDGADAPVRSNNGARPAVVASISLDKLLDPANGSCVGEQLGSGPLTDAQLLALLDDANPIRLLITAMTGEPLWLGRSKRHASAAQFIALAIRDRGCVLCGAAIDRCIAHHILPYNAPVPGPTDLDNLVLLCASCHHHRVHNPEQTIERDAAGRWRTRPALPHEIPPTRPEPRGRPERRPATPPGPETPAKGDPRQSSARPEPGSTLNARARAKARAQGHPNGGPRPDP